MNAAHRLHSGSIFGISEWPGKDRVILTIQNDGITCYDTVSNAAIRSWALGKSFKEFSAPAIYSRTSQHYFVAASTSNGQSSLLSWPHTSSSSTIHQAGNKIHTTPSPIKSIIPVSTLPPKKSKTSTVDGNAGDTSPCVFVAHANGTISLSSTTTILSQCAHTSNMPLIAAFGGPRHSTLVSIHTAQHQPQKGTNHQRIAILVASFTIQNSPVRSTKSTSSPYTLQCTSLHKLDLPESLHIKAKHAQQPLSATYTNECIIILWPDGTVASYTSPSPGSSNSSPAVSEDALKVEGAIDALPAVVPLYTRKLKSFLSHEESAAANGSMDAHEQAAGKGRKKRAHSHAVWRGDKDGVQAAVGVARDGVAIVLHRKGSVLHCTGIDAVHGAVVLHKEYSPAECSMSVFDPGCPLTAIPLSSNGHTVMATCGAAVLLSLDLAPPTLAHLAGALRDTIVAPFGDHDASAHNTETLALGHGHAVNASNALVQNHNTEEVHGDFAGTRAVVQFQLDIAADKANQPPSSDADLLIVKATSIQWAVPGSKSMHEAQRAAWSALFDALHAHGKLGTTATNRGKSTKKKGTIASATLTNDLFVKCIQPALNTAENFKTSLPDDFLCNILMLLSEHHAWNCIDRLLSIQHPGSLSGCLGLATALARSHQYTTLSTLLRGSTDLSSDELSSLLHTILGPPSATQHESDKTSAIEAQRKYAHSMHSMVERIVSHAETSSSQKSHQVSQERYTANIAQARYAAGTVEGFSHRQLCLHSLLCIQHDAAMLVAALRSLSPYQASSLLRYLFTWYMNYVNIIHSNVPEDASTLDLPEGLPCISLTTVLEWINATLDSSMAKLAMRKEAVQLMELMRREVSSDVKSLKSLIQAKGALEHVQGGAPLSQGGSRKGDTSGYSMEWLSLGIS